MRVEIKKKGKWEAVGPVFKNDYGEAKTEEPYGGRNYRLFAFLADVRNSQNIVPISEPKGFPKDVSPSLKEELVDYWDGDGHSASYFTLEELESADWEQEFTNNGVVPCDVYEYLKDINESPKSYSKGISGPKIVTLSETEYKELDWGKKMDGTRWYVNMEWQEKIKDGCRQFLDETIPALRLLGKPDEVRIVFCFDN